MAVICYNAEVLDRNVNFKRDLKMREESAANTHSPNGVFI